MTAFHRAILASAAIVGLTAFAHPEARAADPKEWSLQRFRPAIHSFGAFTTEAARVSHGFTLNAFILANLAGPVLQDAAGDDVVERFGTSNLVVSAGFLDHLSVALDVPVHMLGSGRFLTGEDVQPAGLGDIRLSLKAAALRAYRTLHASAATKVSPGGMYLAGSCSSHVRREAFAQTVAEGFAKAKRIAQRFS
jgi:hypothetical protein